MLIVRVVCGCEFHHKIQTPISHFVSEFYRFQEMCLIEDKLGICVIFNHVVWILRIAIDTRLTAVSRWISYRIHFPSKYNRNWLPSEHCRVRKMTRTSLANLFVNELRTTNHLEKGSMHFSRSMVRRIITAGKTPFTS